MDTIAGKYANPGAGKSGSGKTPLLIGIIAVLVAVIVGLLIWIVSLTSQKPVEKPETPGQETVVTKPPEKLVDSIALPGYAGLHLKAGVKEQNLTLPNPPENFCQVRMSLILEDGTVIWTSDLTVPGETAQIILQEPLEAGDYNATLKYDCFRMDEAQSQLNGGSCNLKLHVH